MWQRFLKRSQTPQGEERCKKLHLMASAYGCTPMQLMQGSRLDLTLNEIVFDIGFPESMKLLAPVRGLGL